MEAKAAARTRKEAMKELHEAMDSALASRDERLRQAKAQKDSERLWQLITASVDDGLVKYLGLAGQQEVSMRGRSKVQFVNVWTGAKEEQDIPRGEDCRVDLRRKSAGIQLAQANRLTNNSCRMLAQYGTDDEGVKARNEQHNEEIARAYLKQARQTLTLGSKALEEVKTDIGLNTVQHCLSEVKQVRMSEPLQAAKVMRAAETHRREGKRMTQQVKTEASKRARQLHEDPKRGVRHIGKKLDRQPALPLRYVRRDDCCTDGGRPGSITV